jgi:hypothetical protein
MNRPRRHVRLQASIKKQIALALLLLVLSLLLVFNW